MTETERSHDKLWRYSVTAVIHDVSRVNDYLDWLLDGHAADVCQWASDAEVVHLSTGDDHVPLIVSCPSTGLTPRQTPPI